MSVVTASQEQLPSVARLLLEEFAKPPFNESASLSEVLESVRFYHRIGRMFVVVQEEVVVGVLVCKLERWWQGDVLIIEDLAVKESLHNQGVGSQLLSFVQSYACQRNVVRMQVMTRAARAVAFYEKHGFVREDGVCVLCKRL